MSRSREAEMRLAGLEFIRYGRFTGARLDFKRRVMDLHVVHGPNEAGKSTARAAVSDLLFGFPHLTRWDFVHDQTSLALGGVVESEGRRLAFRRRKGRKDTLLSPEGAPLGEDALRPFLGEVGRDRFETLYSLDAVERQLGEAEQAVRLAAEALERETARRQAVRLDEPALGHGAAVEAAV